MQARLRLAAARRSMTASGDETGAELGDTLAAARRLVADPDCGDISLPARRLLLAEVLGRAAKGSQRSGYLPQAADLFDEQMGQLTAAAADPTAPADTRQQAARLTAAALTARGVVRSKVGQDVPAEADLREAVRRYAALDAEAVKGGRPDDALKKEYAAAVQELADLLLVQNRLAEAAGPYLTMLDLNKQLAFDPEVQEQRKALAQAYYRTGLFAERKNGKGKGLPFFKSGLAVVAELAEAATPGTVGEARARVLVGLYTALCGDHAAATRDLPKLIAAVKSVNTQASVRYDAAFVYATAAGAADGPAADKYKAEAFAQLDWLLAPPVELADVVALRTDPYLEPIRSDPRFAAAVAKAEANAKGRAAEGKK